MSLFPVFSPGGEVPFPTITGLLFRVRADLGITKDGGDFVSQWDDQSASAAHLTEATNKPVWVDALVNGKPAVRFDGTNDKLVSGSFTSTSQPHHTFVVFNSVTWATVEAIMVGTSNNFYVDQNGTTPEVKQRAQGSAGNAVSATVGTFFLVSSFFSGAASYQALNNAASVGPSNTGTGGAVTTLALGSEVAGSNFGNVEIAEAMLYNAEITGTDLTDLKSYFNSRYALW